MNKPRIVFTDVDGTSFINETQTVLESTLIAFRKLRENDIKVFICTSRSYQETLQLPREYLKEIDGIICSTGSFIYYKGKLIKRHDLDNKELEIMINIFDKYNCVYRYITKDNIGYLNKYNIDAINSFKYLYDYVPDIKPYDNEIISNLMCFTLTDKIKNKKLYEELYNKLSNSNLLDLIQVIEITNKGINKGSGIKDVCNKLNIDIKDTIGFGDSLNDIDMFNTVNYSIAMGNAKEQLKQYATYITDNINDDGFYNACINNGWIK